MASTTLTVRKDTDARMSEGYLVFDSGKCVGRIFFAEAGAPKDAPWFWGMEFHHLPGRKGPQYGQAPTRDAAMAAFKAAWRDGGANEKAR